MERFESKVMRVFGGLVYERLRIESMAAFGWSLQSRQDVVEPVRASSTIDGDEIETDIQVTHYVALHFVRPLSLPHLEEIKQLESEYYYNPLPQKIKMPGILGLLFEGSSTRKDREKRVEEYEKKLSEWRQRRKELKQRAKSLLLT